MAQCKICMGASRQLFVGRVLRKYDVEYTKCRSCGFVQTEEPYWLDEAYSDAVSDLDIGPVQRAVWGAQVVENIILFGLDPRARYVDWGGGYGVFARLMRDAGYDFYWQDRYCQNLFAKQFVVKPGVRYELLTAFEVFEHLTDPISEIEKMVDTADNIYCTTLLVPDNLQPDWWYLAPETGQHIAFYTLQALQIIAERFKLHVASDGAGNHLLAKKQVTPRLFQQMVANGRAAKLKKRLLRRKNRITSLLESDFRTITGWHV